MKKQKHIKQTKKPLVEVKSFSWRRFSEKILFLFIAILSVVLFTDKKEYFTADQTNNHIKKKWISFFDYTAKKKGVDVFILGNSHIITGVDPFILSDATSSTCFILGNSGTSVIDAWFQLGAALKYTQPKLVILETYCIGNHEKSVADLVPLFQSFDSQKDRWYKLQCMPRLFYSDNWIEAWSPSVRNHSFLLKDTTRIRYNIKNPKLPKSNKLDLGRFARFGSGLQDSTLAKYVNIGSPVSGKEYQISAFSKKYLQKIMKMCEERNIPVLFLTAPMYYKHISDYDVWKSTLNDELQKYPNSKWFDLQFPYDTTLYTPDKFENTYGANQHQSNMGMIITAYKLAGFIDKNYPDLLPNRSKDEKWIEDFKITEHFVYNQDVPVGIAGISSIIKDKPMGNFHIRELALKEGENSNRLILKIDKHESLPDILTVQCNVIMQGNRFLADLEMLKIKEIFPPNHVVYLAEIRNDVKVTDILNIQK